MKKTTLALGLTVLSLLATPELQAQRPAGPAFPIAADYTGSNFTPTLAADASGRYVVVWTRWSDEEGIQSEIVFRRYDQREAPISRRFEVNQFRPGYQQTPDVAMNASGWFAVVWSSSDQDGNELGAYARLYHGREAVTDEILVPIRTQGTQQSPRIGIDASGNFIVVWDDAGPGPLANTGIFAQRFSKTGQRIGKPTRVNLLNTTFESSPDVAMNPDGSYIVVWRRWLPEHRSAGIFGRRFDAKGRAVEGEFQIHESAIPNAGTPTVALGPQGQMAVTWDRCESSAIFDRCTLHARLYSAASHPLSGEFLVSPEGTFGNPGPTVAFNARGDFAITWSFCGSDSEEPKPNCRIATRFFGPRGNAFPNIPIVTSDNNLLLPVIVGFESDFLVVWDSLGCSSDFCGESPEGVYAQRYRLK